MVNDRRYDMNLGDINCDVSAQDDNWTFKYTRIRVNVGSYRVKGWLVINGEVFGANFFIDGGYREYGLASDAYQNKGYSGMDLFTRLKRNVGALASVGGTRYRVRGIYVKVLMWRPRGLYNVRYQTTTRYCSNIKLRYYRLDYAIFNVFGYQIELGVRRNYVYGTRFVGLINCELDVTIFVGRYVNCGGYAL